jgi:hypothetical protein
MERRNYFNMLLAFVFTVSSINLSAQDSVVINEILPNGTVELKNVGGATVDVSMYQLCNFPSYMMIAQGNVICGNTMMMPGDILVVDNFNNLNMGDGELGLYINGDFSNPLSMLDYVEWGSSGHQRSGVAQNAGIWTAGDFFPALSAGQSMEYAGAGDGSASWVAQANPSICAENGTGAACMVEGGILDGGPFEFCVDSVPDFVANIFLAANSGSSSQYVITTGQGVIVDLPNAPEDVDFNAFGIGTCLIWHLSYEDTIQGLAVGNNALTDLMGCFDFSNSITVDRIECDPCLVQGGVIGAQDFEFCIDSIPDFVDGLTAQDFQGDLTQWVVTDQSGSILGLPTIPDEVDFNAAGAGVCLIWHLAYEEGLTGLETGMNVSGLAGCFDFSDDFVTVTRQFCDSCVVDGGSVGSAMYEFCLDSVPDFVSNEIVSGNSGPLNQWLLTDDAGMILELPLSPDEVDFNAAAPGTCLIWHLSYQDGLVGLEPGMNALQDLEGCYDLSDDFITVVRQNCDSCTVFGGQLSGGPFSFCVGDSIADFIDAGAITLAGNTGSSQWIVTDDSGVILGLPASYTDVDFDNAPAGTCLVHHMSFDGTVGGLELGANVSGFTGCFDISNSIEVVRVTEGPPCVVSLDEQMLLQTVSIYPNPAEQDLTVNNHGDLAVSIVLIDVTGRQVSDVQLLNANVTRTIDVSTLEAGMYVVMINNGASRVSKTLIKH